MTQQDTERWTVGRLLNWTAEFLKKKGAESPRLDAEVLLAHVLEWSRVSLYTHFDDEIGDQAKATYRELVKKRAEGAPVAYLVGRKEFFSLPLTVSSAVLIPRPDTETVVVAALEFLKGKQNPRVVDIGTGSGCLALAIAKHHESAEVVAVDLSQAALDVASANARTLELADRVSFLLGNLFDPVASQQPFDLIVSNPPYIRSGDIETLEAGVRDFEPHLALDGGDDGLRVVADLVERAPKRLASGGCLLLEIGSAQEAPVLQLIGDQPEFLAPTTIRDSANHPRVIRALRQ